MQNVAPRFIELPSDLFLEIIGYLNRQPWIEVHKLMARIQASQFPDLGPGAEPPGPQPREVIDALLPA